MLILGVDEFAQQFTPGWREILNGLTDHLLAVNAGDQLHGQIPDQDLAIVIQRADTHRQVQQHLAVVAAQGIEFALQATHLGERVAQFLFEIAHTVAEGDTGVLIHMHPFADDHARHGRTQQPRHIELDALLEPLQLHRAGFRAAEIEILQRAVHLLLGGIAAHHRGQLIDQALG